MNVSPISHPPLIKPHGPVQQIKESVEADPIATTKPFSVGTPIVGGPIAWQETELTPPSQPVIFNSHNMSNLAIASSEVELEGEETIKPGQIAPHSPPVQSGEPGDKPKDGPFLDLPPGQSPPWSPIIQTGTGTGSTPINTSKVPQIEDHSPPVQIDDTVVTPAANPPKLPPIVSPEDSTRLYDPAIMGPSNQIPTKQAPIKPHNPVIPADVMKQVKPTVKGTIGLIAPHSPPVQTTASMLSNGFYKKAGSLISDTSTKAIHARAYQTGFIKPLNITA